MLVRIPGWLARDGFTACLREGLEDIETKFFIPKHGFVKERIQVKRERITNRAFGTLLRGFMSIYSESPSSYQWFTLVLRELADELRPLESGLRRIRDPYSFYSDDEAVQESSYQDYLARAQALGYSEEEAQFLFEHVLIDTDIPDADHAEGLFTTALNTEFPEYTDFSAKLHREIFNRTKLLVQSRKNQEISRRDIEQTIRSVIPVAQQPPQRSIHLHTIGVVEKLPPPAIHFEWEAFFGGQSREYPPMAQWNESLLPQLQATKDWLLNYRRTEGTPISLSLTGSRRLSAALAIGFTFPAVAGFTIEMNHRGQIWATNSFEAYDNDQYPITTRYVDMPSDGLVVSISIPNQDITLNVEQFIAAHSTEALARLHIKGERTIQSSRQANTAVNNIKQAILQALARGHYQNIHLFFAGPSFLALFLGHRLNATANIQCYEHISSSLYVPTCTLIAR